MKTQNKKPAIRAEIKTKKPVITSHTSENARNKSPDNVTPSTFLSAKDLAEMTGVSIQYIGRMRKDGTLIATDGRYDMSNPVNLEFVEKHSTDTDDDDLQESEQKKNIRLRNIKLQLEIDIKSKKYLETAFIEKVLMRYIERLHSDVERRASVILDDFFHQIIADNEKDGHLQNVTRCKFQDEFLCLVDDCKKNMIREIKAYRPEDYPG